jgi:hypothetical protein
MIGGKTNQKNQILGPFKGFQSLHPQLEVTISAARKFEPTSPWGEGEELTKKPILFQVF